jgi:hypothetical protein
MYVVNRCISAVPLLTPHLQMGFTESSHPTLPGKIRAQLPKDTRAVTKTLEDEVVTNLLEDLLSREATPRSPVASGSGIQRDQDTVPGGWQH